MRACRKREIIVGWWLAYGSLAGLRCKPHTGQSWQMDVFCDMCSDGHSYEA